MLGYASDRSFIRPSRTSLAVMAPSVLACFPAISLMEVPASKCSKSALSSISFQERPAFPGNDASRSTRLAALSSAFTATNSARITEGLLKGVCEGSISPVSGSIPFANASMTFLASSGVIKGYFEKSARSVRLLYLIRHLDSGATTCRFCSKYSKTINLSGTGRFAPTLPYSRF